MSGDPNWNQGRNPWRDPRYDRDIAKKAMWSLFVAGVALVSIFSAVAVVFPRIPR